MSRHRSKGGRDPSRPYNPALADALAAARGARAGAQPTRAPVLPVPAASPAEDEERRLLERELAGVRPLPPGPGRVALRAGKPEARPPRSRRALAAPAAALSVERRDGNVTGARFGVSRETLRYLARGEFLAEARCDLHGLRAEAAGQRLRAFVEESVARGRRTVLVVCGRGLHSGPAGPVLLEVASQTLAQSSVARHVQAFASSTPGRGGEGALMVLLRRPRLPDDR